MAAETTVIDLYGEQADSVRDDLIAIFQNARIGADDIERFFDVNQPRSAVDLEYLFLIAAAARPEMSVIRVGKLLVEQGLVSEESDFCALFLRYAASEIDERYRCHGQNPALYHLLEDSRDGFVKVSYPEVVASLSSV